MKPNPSLQAVEADKKYTFMLCSTSCCVVEHENTDNCLQATSSADLLPQLVPLSLHDSQLPLRLLRTSSSSCNLHRPAKISRREKKEKNIIKTSAKRRKSDSVHTYKNLMPCTMEK